MLPLERHRKLLEILIQDRSVRTAQLAQMLGVTQETIRRDFEKLESDGSLLRTHGGAVMLEAARREHPVSERSQIQTREKLAIAQAALPLIESGQTVFFDPSTSVQALVSILPDEPLTVITNSLQIPALLAGRPEIRVICLGGNFRSSSMSCTGKLAEYTAGFFRVDAAFISCRGIDVENGLSDATEEQAWLKRQLVARARKFYLLADASKVGLSSSFFFAENAEIDEWITDREPASGVRAIFESQSVEIRVARS